MQRHGTIQRRFNVHSIAPCLTERRTSVEPHTEHCDTPPRKLGLCRRIESVMRSNPLCNIGSIRGCTETEAQAACGTSSSSTTSQTVNALHLGQRVNVWSLPNRLMCEQHSETYKPSSITSSPVFMDLPPFEVVRDDVLSLWGVAVMWVLQSISLTTLFPQRRRCTPSILSAICLVVWPAATTPKRWQEKNLRKFSPVGHESPVCDFLQTISS
jgi:hypothetical protein